MYYMGQTLFCQGLFFTFLNRIGSFRKEVQQNLSVHFYERFCFNIPAPSTKNTRQKQAYFITNFCGYGAICTVLPSEDSSGCEEEDGSAGVDDEDSGVDDEDSGVEEDEAGGGVDEAGGSDELGGTSGSEEDGGGSATEEDGGGV